MDVGREAIRFVQGAHAHEAQLLPCPGVGAEERHPAHGAAGNLLALATVARRVDEVGRPLYALHAVGLDQDIEHERGAGLALAPAAVTAVHDEGRAQQAVTHGAAGTAAIGGEGGWFSHGVSGGLEVFHDRGTGEKRRELRAPFTESRRTTEADGVILERAPAYGQRVAGRRFDRTAQLVRNIAGAGADQFHGVRKHALELALRGSTDRDHRQLENHGDIYPSPVSAGAVPEAPPGDKSPGAESKAT